MFTTVILYLSSIRCSIYYLDEEDDDRSEDQILQGFEEESLNQSTVVIRKVPKKKHAPLQKYVT